MLKYFFIYIILFLLHFSLSAVAVEQPKVEAVPSPEIESTESLPGKVKDPPAKVKPQDVDLINTKVRIENKKCRLVDGVMKCTRKKNIFKK